MKNQNIECKTNKKDSGSNMKEKYPLQMCYVNTVQLSK